MIFNSPLPTRHSSLAAQPRWTRLQQSKGETEEEFEARYAELVAKSKSGKSSAKRRMPETDEEFAARLAEKYAEPGMFHREMLYLSRERFDQLRAELWELTQAFLHARRSNGFYQNTSFCFQHGRPCPYFQLCRSGGNPNVLGNLYTKREPHEELRTHAAHRTTSQWEIPWWWNLINGRAVYTWTVEMQPGEQMKLPHAWSYYWM